MNSTFRRVSCRPLALSISGLLVMGGFLIGLKSLSTIPPARTKRSQLQMEAANGNNSVFSPGRLNVIEAASGIGGTGIKSDRGVYPKPPLPHLPRAGGKFFDPVFGTEIMRATDEADGAAPGLGTYYSHWPTFNRDNTRLLIRKGETGVAIIKTFDPSTFTIGKGFVTLPTAMPGGGGPNWESSIWSNSNPDLIYTFPNYYDGRMGLYTYNVASKTFRLVKDLSSLSRGKDYLRQMYMSADDDVFCWLHMRAGTDGAVSYLVYKRSTDRVIYHNPASDYVGGINEVHVDKSGKWLTIHVNQNQPDNTRTRVLNLQSGKIDKLKWDDADSPPGHGDLGTGTIVGFDSFVGGINKRSFDKFHSPEVIIRFKNEQGKTDWTFDHHGTMLADEEGWETIGTYHDPSIKLPNYHLFEDEIVQIATDGSQRFRRICHTRSAIDNLTSTTSYWAMPKPTISHDGRFIAFTSNWEKSGRYDLFIVKIDSGGSISSGQTRPKPSTIHTQRLRRVRPN
jgi:hypothetical protein